MLTLQRASAGSGKTYTLARTFIRLLISITDENGKRRLRKPEEFPDAVSHILAITFTNKATAEMKERIIIRLADLAGRNSAPTTAYLNDFMKEFGATEEEIRIAAKHALISLLNNYSFFQISTIDSFFQTVLRTFTYEVELNDSFQVELDSDFLIHSGIDITIRQIREQTADPETIYWIKELMEEALVEGSQWNLHSSSKKNSVRNSLSSVVRQLEKEDFKRHRKDFYDYFRQFPDYSKTVETYRKYACSDVDQALATAKHMADRVKITFESYDIPLSEGMQYLEGHINKILSHTNIFSPPQFKHESNRDKIAINPLKVLAANSKNKKSASPSLIQELASRVLEFYQAIDSLKKTQASDKFLLWQIYKPTLPFPALMNRVRANVLSFLKENNLVELSDTNTLLAKVIGDDDTPFIYERLGTRLEHFLIDEFQDTSGLQWENLKPLVAESLSRDRENLIIGDAKQSIYRFRNADPSLITSQVPYQFRHFSLCEAGNSLTENTNHRSLRRIVEFNNLFFLLLADYLDRADATLGIPVDQPEWSLRNLYSNVVQYPAKREDLGYVEINLIRNNSQKETDTDDIPDKYHFIAPLIESLLQRGYRQNEIAILVDKNSQGKEIIAHLVKYNSSLQSTQTRIDFISDESLQLGISRAVRIVISTLEMLALVSLPDSPTTSSQATEKSESSKKINGTDVTSMFAFFSATHPELDPGESIQKFLEVADHRQPLEEMLLNMYSISLPALVEAITATFVPKTLRESDAPFLAALQDAVLDYCSSYSPDIISFLGWWGEKGEKLSISSPEGTDAVSIMTIHKSKGLEFKCVILPEFNLTFGRTTQGRKPEYIWVKPDLDLQDNIPLPPIFPVKIDHKIMPFSPLRNQYISNLFSYTMDTLNQAYVAFTRAAEELYVFANIPAPSKKKPQKTKTGIDDQNEKNFSFDKRSSGSIISDLLHPQYLEKEARKAKKYLSEEERLRLANTEFIDYFEDEQTGNIQITFGVPVDLAALDEIKKEKKKGKVNDNSSSITPIVKIADSYSPQNNNLTFHYISRPGDSSSASTLDTSEVSDPRSRGNMLHEILENVATIDDLPVAVKRKRISGELTLEAAEKIEIHLRELISQPNIISWFDDSWQLLRERPILTRERKWCPDRVMISHDRKKAIVVDYKFGSVDKTVYEKSHAGYRRQVKNYCRQLEKALGIKNVEGFLWYAARNVVEKV